MRPFIDLRSPRCRCIRVKGINPRSRSGNMRIQITIFAMSGLLTCGLSTAGAQGLKVQVNVQPQAEVSLGDLARQVNPSASTGPTRVYTNADLRMRPAPVAPVMPPFPEVAPSRGILE